MVQWMNNYATATPKILLDILSRLKFQLFYLCILWNGFQIFLPPTCHMFWWKYIDHTYTCHVNMQTDSVPPEIQEITRSINKIIWGQLFGHLRDRYSVTLALPCWLENVLAVPSKQKLLEETEIHLVHTPNHPWWRD